MKKYSSVPMTFAALGGEAELQEIPLTPVSFVSQAQVPDAPASARDLQRRVPVTMVDGRTIRIPTAEKDPIYENLMLEVLKGNLPLGHTRVDTTRIRAHFRVGEGSDATVKYGTSEPDSVTSIMAEIRRGYRSTPWLYYDQSADEFVCPDDVNTLRAYAQLGVETIPAAVIDPNPSTLSHSCFKFRALLIRPGHLEPNYYYDGLVVPDIDAVCVLDCYRYYEERPLDALAQLSGLLGEQLGRLRQFHENPAAVHYHHHIASVLVRMCRIFDTVHRLCDGGFIEQAEILVRSAYEMALSFYADWLYPGVVGSTLRDITMMNPRQISRMGKELTKSMIDHGDDEELSSDIGKRVGSFYGQLSKPGKLAEINPVFVRYHRELYGRYSKIAHQDFSESASFSGALNSEDFPNSLPPRDMDERLVWLAQTSILVASQLRRCISSDIGTLTGDDARFVASDAGTGSAQGSGQGG
jgi:hypothetical protein